MLQGLTGSVYRCLLIGLSLTCVAVYADTEHDGKLFDYTLEQLLNTKVSVASYEQQKIIEAPLIVSRYSRKTLEKMGVQSLEEMIGFVPGLLLQHTQSNNSAIMSRGLVDSFNQKILFLLDGVPYWAPSHSAIPLHGIPFNAISHIEVIRGPAAIYYGTNASAGVINIITYQSTDSQLRGQFGEAISNAQLVFNKNSDAYWLTLSAEKQNDSGQQAYIENISPNFGLPDETEFIQSMDKQSVLLRAGFDHFSFMLQAFESISNDLDNTISVPALLTEGLTYRGKLAHVDYSSEIGNTEFTLSADYNQFSLKFPIRNSLVSLGQSGNGGFRFQDESDNYRWRTAAKANTHINDHYSILWGYEYEFRQTSEYQVYNQQNNATLVPIMQARDLNEQALFFQNDLTFNDWRFILGGRYVNNQNSRVHFSPQASAIYQLNHHQSIKLLFAEGFNSPNFVQQGINFGPALQGNPDLTAEKIRTFDLAYTYSSNHQLFVANLFYAKADDLIQRNISSGIIQFDNTGEIKRSGFELDYQWEGEALTLFANASYLHQGDSIQDDMAASVSPKTMLSIGVLYPVNDSHSLGLSDQFVSSRAMASSHQLLNIHYQYQHENIDVFLTAKNLLDEDLISTDIQNFTQDQLITNQQGFYWLAGIRFNF